MKRLGTDVIDLYQVHWPFRHIAFEEAQAELERLREEGKIRHIGVSNFGQKDLESWMASGSCVSDQLGYNLLFRAIEFQILSACGRHNVGVLAYMPLMQGLLADRWKTPEEVPEKRRRTRHFAATRSGVRHQQAGCETLTFKTLDAIREVCHRCGQPMEVIALAWLINQPNVASAIIGARKPEQLKRNLAALDLALTSEVRDELGRITAPLKDLLGANADMWEPADKTRIQ